ncbi:acyltransferase family protein [Paraburkholderia sp. BR13444]|uniref:acyltransferase family protein n=1 Tax=Paraburkholderia sp. BR13444 TaxID=3236997 RepID=UPI0034CD56B8
MTANRSPAPRVAWLEGLRGAATVQVFLLHYLTAFFPGANDRSDAPFHFGWEAWIARPSPLFWLFDGYSAVYVFFLLSGTVLTYSFRAAPLQIPRQVVRRVARLIGPVFIAAALASLLFSLLPGSHVAAGAVTGSTKWLATIGPDPFSVSHFVREVAVESLFTGYQWSTLFPSLEPHLDTIAGSFNAPLWTLHCELWGSFLVMALVATQHVSRKLYRGLLIATPILFWSHPLMLFVAGHLLADFAQRERDKSIWRSLAAAASLALGVALGCARDWPVVDGIRQWLTPLAVRGDDLFHFQSQLGAFFVYLAVLTSVRLQRWLSSRPFLRLGKLSFSVYLVHFPVLFTVSCSIFLMFAPLGYGVAVALACGVGVVVTALLALAFERWVDGIAVQFARNLGKVRTVRVHQGI